MKKEAFLYKLVRPILKVLFPLIYNPKITGKENIPKSGRIIIAANHTDDYDCILFMWATFPNLPDALRVIQEWGFTYKTLGFSWIKTNKKNGKYFFGIGYYTKSNAEICLIATKGKPKPISNYVSSVIVSPRREHSRKPDEIRDKIVELVGDMPRIELFARQTVDGWDCWGNEV